MERRAGSTVELKPVDVDGVVDSIVVYPRLARVKKAYRLNLTPEVAAQIMKLKYLAVNGGVPAESNPNYCQKCRYRELCMQLRSSQLVDVNSVEMPVPLPVIAAVELEEAHNIDLDMLFYGKYLHELYWRIRREFRKEGAQPPLYLYPTMEQSWPTVRLLSDITSMHTDEVKAALETYRAYRDLVDRVTSSSNILPSTCSEAKTLVGKGLKTDKIVLRSLHAVLETCTYPLNSIKRVRDAYAKLQKLLH